MAGGGTVTCGRTWHSRGPRDVPRAGLGWWHLAPAPPRGSSGSHGGLGSLGSGIGRGDPCPEQPKNEHSCRVPACPLRVPVPSAHPAMLCSPVPPPVPRDGLGGRGSGVGVRGRDRGRALAQGGGAGGAGIAGILRYVSFVPSVSPRATQPRARCGAVARGGPRGCPRVSPPSVAACGSSGTSFEDDLTLGAEGTGHPRGSPRCHRHPPRGQRGWGQAGAEAGDSHHQLLQEGFGGAGLSPSSAGAVAAKR